jgi:DnaJ-class molecular chaperone
MMGMNTTQATCAKCNGTGKTRWMHVDNGRCFDCAGSGRCVTRHVGVQKVAPRSAAEERQSFINRFAAVVRNVKSSGAAFLSELHDEQSPELGTERDNVCAWLRSDRCPADVRARALAALASVGA